MIKRITILFLSATCLTCFTSCTVLGGLVQSILRLPSTVLGSVGSIAEAEAEKAGDDASGQPKEKAPDAVSIVVTPVK